MRLRQRGLMTTRVPFVLVFSWIITALSSAPAAAQKQAESMEHETVGHNDLQGRSAYHPAIHKQGGRWIAYVGHHGGENLNTLTGKKDQKNVELAVSKTINMPAEATVEDVEKYAHGMEARLQGYHDLRVSSRSEQVLHIGKIAKTKRASKRTR